LLPEKGLLAALLVICDQFGLPTRIMLFGAAARIRLTHGWAAVFQVLQWLGVVGSL
jgi:hypothetical protein